MAHYSAAGDRLGPLDTLFLYIEKKEMPLHIGSVCVFDGPLSTRGLTALIESKLPIIPRYRQRLAFPPLNAGYPVWESDPDFHLDRHISHTRIQPGTLASLEALAGQVFSEIMDRGRPLWDMTVVDGLPGGHSALIARVHHCLVDGIAGIALMNLMLDPSPRPSRSNGKRTPPPPASGAASLVDTFLTASFHTAERILSLQSAALNVTGGLLRDAFQGSLISTGPAIAETLRPLDPFPFKARSLGPRRVCWAEFPLAEVNAFREIHGAKVNDVLVTALAFAMRRYALLHRIPVANRVLRLMVPVNLRSPEQNGVGNRISLVPVNLPLDVADPIELLHIAHVRGEALKQAHAADWFVLGGTLLTLLPVPLQALLTGALSNTLPVLPFDMVCTNVPGPQVPLYLLGHKMLTYYPYVPVGDFMGVNCAMTSYNGTLYFSLTGDSACAPDLDKLRDSLTGTLVELRARSTPPARRGPRRAARRQPVSALAGLANSAPKLTVG